MARGEEIAYIVHLYSHLLCSFLRFLAHGYISGIPIKYRKQGNPPYESTECKKALRATKC